MIEYILVMICNLILCEGEDFVVIIIKIPAGCIRQTFPNLLKTLILKLKT